MRTGAGEISKLQSCLHLVPQPTEWVKRKRYHVMSRRHCDRSERNIGAQEASTFAIDLSLPPRMPHIVQNDPAAVRAVHINRDNRVLINNQPRRPRPAPGARRDWPLKK